MHPQALVTPWTRILKTQIQNLISRQGNEKSPMLNRGFAWRAVQGSNLRPVVLETTALPTELTTLAPESVARARGSVNARGHGETRQPQNLDRTEIDLEFILASLGEACFLTPQQHPLNPDHILVLIPKRHLSGLDRFLIPKRHLSGLDRFLIPKRHLSGLDRLGRFAPAK
jgi:hypothetical protein